MIRTGNESDPETGRRHPKQGANIKRSGDERGRAAPEALVRQGFSH